MKHKLVSVSLVSVFALTLVACGPSLAVLKGAVSAFSPLISVLIARGTITPAKADQYTKDANSLVDAVGVLQTDWAAAKTKADKVVAIQKFGNTSAAVANDFKTIPQLATALAILNTTLGVLEAFYGDKPAASPNAPHTEKALNDYVKQQAKLLKLALQP